MGQPNVGMFLNQIEHETFKEVQNPLVYSNLSKNDCNIVIKNADKGSCVVIGIGATI